MRYSIQSDGIKLAEEVERVFDVCMYAHMTGNQISATMKDALDLLMKHGLSGPAKVKIDGQGYTISPSTALVLMQSGWLIEKWSSEDGINYYVDFPRLLGNSISALENHRNFTLEVDAQSGKVVVRVMTKNAGRMDVGQYWHGSAILVLTALGLPMDRFNDWGNQMIWELTLI